MSLVLFLMICFAQSIVLSTTEQKAHIHSPKGCVCAISYERNTLPMVGHEVRYLLRKRNADRRDGRAVGHPRHRHYPPPQIRRAGDKNDHLMFGNSIN